VHACAPATPPCCGPRPQPSQARGRRGGLQRWLTGLGLMAGGAVAVADTPPPIALGRSVLKLEARRAQGGYALGSAVVVAPNTLVTNCHVTREATLLQVMVGGLRHTVAAQTADLHHDLCVLHVPGLPAEPVALGNSASLHDGQPVFAVGYTGGMALQASTGQVVALHRLDGAQVVQVDNWFSSGASGGALFDDQQRLVGVLTFRLLGGQAHYFAGPVEWLQPLLRQAGAAVAPLATSPLPYWQNLAAQQPPFLRAQRLLRDGQWQALAGLADDWLRADLGDAEPWYLAGLALGQLGRQPEARLALGCALQIAPAMEAARQALATLGTAPTSATTGPSTGPPTKPSAWPSVGPSPRPATEAATTAPAPAVVADARSPVPLCPTAPDQ